MGSKPETKFRRSTVIPFLKKLRATSYFPIQQLAILHDADFILCARGRFVWLELKDDGEDLRSAQGYKADWVAKTGGVAIVATPKTWRAVSAQLSRLDEGDSDD